MKQFWSELPQLAKILIIVAVIALIVWLIIKIGKWSKIAKLKTAFKDDYNAAVAGGQKPSYPDTTYINLSDKIESAGAGFAFGLGTDEEAIYDVFKQMKNDLDVLLLSKAFGARTAPDCVFNCPDLALGGWLANEMSGEAIKEINTILQTQGIKSKF